MGTIPRLLENSQNIIRNIFYSKSRVRPRNTLRYLFLIDLVQIYAFQAQASLRFKSINLCSSCNLHWNQCHELFTALVLALSLWPPLVVSMHCTSTYLLPYLTCKNVLNK